MKKVGLLSEESLSVAEGAQPNFLPALHPVVNRSRRSRDPKSWVEFIIEAIEEAVPGRGKEIFSLAWNRWQDYTAERARAEAERELKKAMPPSAEEEWTDSYQC